ncbi:hypothetical protein EDB89DRAFT_2175105 [Lactarius sanguifluus]|nr:hypothetical protein EDB89DRAFT_2175105 [Lactarius sanguifluus]
MASYYPPPPPNPFSGAYNSRPELYQRQPSVNEQVLANPPDVYAASPVQLAPTPPANFKSPSWPPSAAQVPKSPKTFLQWKADAKAATADFQRNGFPSPVAWVFVEGHEIPPNAVIGGVDRKGPWYIARAFYEGSMGESHNSAKRDGISDSAPSISFHGKEREIDTFEVLVEANFPTRWVYQPLAVAPNPGLAGASFADFKLVVVIDDSDSMEGALWLEARDALAGVAEFSSQKGGEGLDIYCLNSPAYRLNLRSESDIRDYFNTISPDGQTPLGAKLKHILDIYVPRIEDPTINHKPINILVITDGVPTDDPRQVIVDFARRLDAKNVPLRKLGLQFVQIGDDHGATQALKELDDHLGPTHGVRDMVDTVTFNSDEPHLHTEVLVKVVLGALNSEIDSSVVSPAF